MFAIIAAILFGVALLLRLTAENSKWLIPLVLAGCLFVALALALGPGVPWRRGP